MSLEHLIKGLGDRLSRLEKSKKFYHGMLGDLELVATTIIPLDATQNVDTISNEGISEGTTEEALQRLLGYRNLEQIAELINRKYGHGQSKNDKKIDANELFERLTELQEKSGK